MQVLKLTLEFSSVLSPVICGVGLCLVAGLLLAAKGRIVPSRFTLSQKATAFLSSRSHDSL